MSARRGRYRILLLPAVVVLALAAGVAAGTQGVNKSVFVAVVDPSGKPVKDLTAADFAVQEDNILREVADAKAATQPLFIQILADTTKQAGAVGMMSKQETSSGASELIRDIRSSLTGFVRHIGANAPDAQVALMEFGQAAIMVTNFTNKTADLEKGITRLFPKQDAASVLLEALMDANKELEKKSSPRRAIVVLNVEPGDEQSRESGNAILDAFRKSGASLWAVSLQRGELRNPMRDVVLNQLTKFTGGRREFIVGQSAIENWLKTFGDAMMSQYEVTYKRPDAKPATQVLVGIKRQGLRVHANMFAPK
jgi:VWFA-related protein